MGHNSIHALFETGLLENCCQLYSSQFLLNRIWMILDTFYFTNIANIFLELSYSTYTFKITIIFLELKCPLFCTIGIISLDRITLILNLNSTGWDKVFFLWLFCFCFVLFLQRMVKKRYEHPTTHVFKSLWVFFIKNSNWKV